MPNDVVIRIRVSDDGTLQVIDEASGKMKNMGDAAQQASQGGLSSMFRTFTDLKSGFDLMKGTVMQGIELIGELNDLGTESLRTKAALDSLTDNKAEQWATALTSSLNGLVDDTDVMRAAMLALNSGVVTTQGQMEQLARIGGVLGEAFQQDKIGGINSLIMTLQMPGQTRTLKQLGIDISEVEAQYNQLKGTMGEQQAWMTAVFEQGGEAANKLADSMLKGPGTAVERLKVQWEDLKESLGEHVATDIEVTLDLVTSKNPEELSKNLKAFTDNPQLMTILGILSPGAASILRANAPNLGGAAAPPKSYNYPQPTLLPEQQAFLDQAERERQRQAAALTATTGGTWAGGQYIGPTNAPPQVSWWDRLGPPPAWFPEPPSAGPTSVPWTQALAGARGQGNLPPWAMTGTGGDFLGTALTNFSNMLTIGGRDIAGAAQNVVTGFQNAAMAAQRYSSVSEAFGLTGGGIGGELSGEVQTALNARRAVAMKQGSGALAQFDIQATELMNQYKIATGQATRESIAFEQQQQALATQMVAGKLSMADYTRQMLALANTAAAGKIDVDSLSKALYEAGSRTSFAVAWYGKDLTMDALNAEMADVKGRPRRGAQAGKPGGETAVQDPYGGLKDSADKAATATQGLMDKTTALAAALPTQAAVMAGGFDTANSSATKLMENVGNIVKQIAGLQGELIFNVIWKGAGGDTGTGRAPGGGQHLPQGA